MWVTFVVNAFSIYLVFDGLSGQGFSPETVGQWSGMNPVFQEILPGAGKVIAGLEMTIASKMSKIKVPSLV